MALEDMVPVEAIDLETGYLVTAYVHKDWVQEDGSVVPKYPCIPIEFPEGY